MDQKRFQNISISILNYISILDKYNGVFMRHNDTRRSTRILLISIQQVLQADDKAKLWKMKVFHNNCLFEN